MFFDYNRIKLKKQQQQKTSNRKTYRKSQNIWKLNNTLLNNPWAKEETKREIRNDVELNENEYKP